MDNEDVLASTNHLPPAQTHDCDKDKYTLLNQYFPHPRSLDPRAGKRHPERSQASHQSKAKKTGRGTTASFKSVLMVSWYKVTPLLFFFFTQKPNADPVFHLVQRRTRTSRRTAEVN